MLHMRLILLIVLLHAHGILACKPEEGMFLDFHVCVRAVLRETAEARCSKAKGNTNICSRA